MSRRLQNRQRLQVAATAAVAADRWVGSTRRHRAQLALLPDQAIQHLLTELTAIPRIARRLPNSIGPLLQSFTDHPDLTPWLASGEDFFRLCRTVGAVLYGRGLARFVDGADVSALIDDLGPEPWRFGIENALDVAPAEPAGFDQLGMDRNTLVDSLLAAGLRAVHQHLALTMPDHLNDIADALNIDWATIDDSGDADRDNEAVRRVLAHVRTT
jgi:hypothetical protein